MTRNTDGRFAKGFSGNPNGRPREEKRTFTDEQVRDDFLLATEEKFPIPNGDGTYSKLPAIQIINKQLVRKAVMGDTRCILNVIEKRQIMIAEMVKERLALLENYLETLKVSKEYPEDVTDKLLDQL